MMKIRILNIIAICAISIVYISCSEMNDLHDIYLDEGEIVYGPIVDSAVFKPGNERGLIEMYINSQRIETVHVYWNDYNDSTEVSIQGATGVFDILLEDLEEKSYIFQLVSNDEFGNRSLPFEVAGNVLGDNYENSLLTRRGKILSTTDGLLLELSAAPEDNIATVISYENSEGNLVSANILSTVDSYVLADYKIGSEITVSSTYAPEGGIDTIFSPDYTINGPFRFDATDLSIVDYSSQHSAGENGVANIISGSYEVRWHTTAGGSSYPHFATIDMGGERKFTEIGVWRSVYDVGDASGDDRAPDVVQFLVSDDNETWTDLGTFDFNRFINDEQFYEFDITEARYLKFVAVSGPIDYMVLGGISIYGY